MSTLRDIRQWFCRKIGPFEEGIADASGNTTSAMVSSLWPFKSSISQDKLYEGYYLYRPNATAADQADATRVVKTYTASTGTFDNELLWTNAPTSERFELIGIVPPEIIHDCINEALRRIWVPVEFTFTVSSTTARRHSLATRATWLSNPLWVRQMGVLMSTETRADTDPFSRKIRGEAYRDGGITYLWTERGFQTTDTVYVRAIRPAYTYCRLVETQTVAITGTPTGGTYTLTYSGSTTAALTYNASATDVQSALRALAGLSQVVVTQAGTTPNYTHTVRFAGLEGDAAALTATSSLTGGTPVITIATTQTGQSFGARSGLVSDTDECVPVVDWVGWGAITELWNRYAQQLPTEGDRRIRVNRAEAAAHFSAATETYYQEPTRSFRRLPAWGPR